MLQQVLLACLCTVGTAQLTRPLPDHTFEGRGGSQRRDRDDLSQSQSVFSLLMLCPFVATELLAKYERFTDRRLSQLRQD